MSKQHSPLPWRAGFSLDESEPVVWAPTCKGSEIERACVVFDPGWREESIANAAFIVRCVNSHDALVNALNRLIAASRLPRECTHGEEPDYCDGCTHAMEIASRDARIHALAALALAEAE